ncbi:MAG TPA: prepilin-type N-terminal cleavage/methylation domain-containing protein [Gaiellaceae bacterium]|nr:prepilin-type N-terminal cleavage/methylation domain-containing protein [Gaiellaceae bacterium]
MATLRALGRRAGSDTGFTVIELIVSMAILLVVVVSLTGALVSMSNTESDVNNRFQTQAQARQALTKLTREIHCANQIQDGSGAALSSTPVDAITVTLPAGCPTGGAAAVTVRWCTVANGTKYDLYRFAGGGCGSAGGVRWATSLVSATPFSLPTAATSGDHYPLVHVDLSVNTRVGGSHGTYELVSDIAALNSERTATG